MIEVRKHHADIMIIGGGIHGCSAALHLLKQGFSVIVLEKDTVARHASGVNAGGVRRLGRDLQEVPLSVLAQTYWQDIAALVDNDCGYRQSYYIKLARCEEDMTSAKTRVALLEKAGFFHEKVIDKSQLSRFVPDAVNQCIGGLFVDGDGAALPYKTTMAFKLRAEKLGGQFYERSQVLKIDRRGSVWCFSINGRQFEAPIVINAAGAWFSEIANQLGDDIELEAHAPMLAITSRMPYITDAVLGVLNGALSLKQFANGTLLLGGGVRGRAIKGKNKTILNMKGLASFVKTAIDVIPILKNVSLVRSWAGIEGYTPDNLPILGKGQEEGVYHMFGFSAHGFQLSPATGEIIASLIMKNVPAIDIEAFKPNRFKV